RLRRARSNHMPFPVELPDSFAKRVTDSDSAQVGLFISSGSETNAEIAASAGFDWLLIDAEHSPYGLETVTSLLRTVAAYPATREVPTTVNYTVLIKQDLVLGAQYLRAAIVHNAEQSEKAVAAIHYSPRRFRGIGAALARSSRFNGVVDYLNKASETVSLT